MEAASVINPWVSSLNNASDTCLPQTSLSAVPHDKNLKNHKDKPRFAPDKAQVNALPQAHLPGVSRRPQKPKTKKLDETLKGVSEIAVDSICFDKWCSFLATSVLRTRTSFACFLRSTLHLQRDVKVSSSPAFPLPVPFPGIFAKMPSGLSSTKRRRIHFRRAFHVLVMALNFWWSGSCFIPLEHLRRTPSRSQEVCLRRLSGLMLADGPGDSFQVLASGRRFPQLVARLHDLCDLVTKLGAGAGPYDRTFAGHDVPLNNDRFPELEPYKSLDADRLRVVGSGHWDASEFLSEELCFAYRYPDSLLFDHVPKPGEYPMKMDSAMMEVGKLAKLWDIRGLLGLHDIDLASERPHELVKVFNCLKNVECDRQIGDRRGRNLCEMKVCGPSSSLPAAADLLDFFVDSAKETLSIICTDRRDFYHQFATTWNRTLSNTVGPVLPLDLLRDLDAFKAFATAKQFRKKQPREQRGDCLGTYQRQSFRRCDQGHAMICFKSILQGDHAGVEIATDGHAGLLQAYGLLDRHSRLVADRPFEGDDLLQGLVIDDFFAISKIRTGDKTSAALKCLRVSKQAYSDFEILGSDDKDVIGARKAKVIGASIDASNQTQCRGHVLVGSPAAKRYGLSWISLQISQLVSTSDSLHLCVLGGWSSILMFRRPFMSILQKSFGLVDTMTFDASCPKIIGLPRPVAGELTLLSVLCPLMTSDLAAQMSEWTYATDASLSKGAIVKARLAEEVSKAAWRCCRSKGAYSRLVNAQETALARSIGCEPVLEEPVVEGVPRPIAYRFDFVEVFAGAALVTKYVSEAGFSTSCPIELSADPELDVSKLFVLEWLMHLIQNRLIKGFMLEPPCTTFSIMRRPPLRSKACPLGFDLNDPQTSVGTKLAYRALQLLHCGWRFGVTGLLENPWTSKMKFLPAWVALIRKENISFVRCDSCAYGSPHLKSFVFVGAWADLSSVSARCSGGHSHVLIQGSLTKASATYTEQLAKALSVVVIKGILRMRVETSEFEEGKTGGLENQLVNEISSSSAWTLDSAWSFSGSSHINLLEMSVILRLVHRLIRGNESLRVLALVDSNVVRCAVSKGRSSSRALNKLLCRITACLVLGGLYLNLGFCPTRLNPSDDPTRDVPLRSPSFGLDLESWPIEALYKLSGLPKMRRWISNWARLALLLGGPSLLDLKDRSLFRSAPYPFGLPVGSVPGALSRLFPALDFDSTLGFPGEGPVSPASFWPPLKVLVVVGFCSGRSHGAFVPRNAGDLSRARAREARPPLQDGRPVLEVTQANRRAYLESFDTWLRTVGSSLDILVNGSPIDVENINRLLVRYGRVLYAIGRPYGHYAETINGVASRRPAVRRQLQEAWNLAFSWLRDEPSHHHVAMPWQILLGAITVCIAWGWIEVAGMFALTWGALLRVGEFLSATRADLLLPEDTNYTHGFALLAIREPKTRFSAARHQCAKLDIPDLLKVVQTAFSSLQPHQRLWSRSGQLLRTRFRQVMNELGITTDVRLGSKTLDLGSLRPGGATWVLQQTEDADFCRRRGRWLNQRIMEIYIQEISSFQILAILPPQVKSKVFALANLFPSAVLFASECQAATIPVKVWWLLWKAQVNQETTGDVG